MHLKRVQMLFSTTRGGNSLGLRFALKNYKSSAILFIILVVSAYGFDTSDRVISNDSLGPEVELCNASFFTQNNYTKTSNSQGDFISYKLPITLKTVQFVCKSSYPTSWKFRTPPYEDSRIKDITINKILEIGTFKNQSSYNYISYLDLSFKDSSSSFPYILCRSSSHNTQYTEIIADSKAETDSNNAFNIHINILRNNHSVTGTNETSQKHRLGTNKYCNLTLSIDLEKESFACGNINGQRNLTKPQIVHCNSQDECNSIIRKDTHCNNTEFRECADQEDVPCFKFSSSNSPGVIICRDTAGNSIARRYLKIQTSEESTLHIGRDTDYENKTLHLSLKSKQSIYSGQDVTFVCKGTGFHYSYGFQWALSNRSTVIQYLGPGNETFDSSMQLYQVEKIIHIDRDWKTFSNIQVICYGPRWIQSTWFNASIALDIKEPSKPHITNMRMVPVATLDKNGITNRTDFFCTASAEPQPVVNWLFHWDGLAKELKDQSNDTSSKILSKISIISENSSTVTSKLTIFYQVHKTAQYSCRATNFIGKEDYKFPAIDALGWEILTIIVISVTLVVITVGAFCIVKRQRNKLQMLTESEIEEFKNGNPNAENALLLPYNFEFEIPREKITIESNVLGDGQFGMVFLGRVNSFRSAESGSDKVAVKKIKKTSDIAFFKALLSEIKIMSFVGEHPYLVKFVGACTRNIRKKEVFVITEYCANGNLRNYLRKIRGNFVDQFNCGKQVNTGEQHNAAVLNCISKYSSSEFTSPFISTKHLIMWSHECANAMAFLASKNVIHGDLAARNILLSDLLHVKVCDLGLSKQLYDYSIYIQKVNCPLPLKWMAIESLQDLEFSIQSDIWSYGITLWEIFSLGQSPYPGIAEWNFQSYKQLLSGYRMESPHFSDESIYAIMKACWNTNPKSRPTFAKLSSMFLEKLQILV